MGKQFLGHIPNSPDLGSSDFHLFSHLKTLNTNLARTSMFVCISKDKKEFVETQCICTLLTEANYPKVIEALKDRFGDEVILTEVYVRQLLKLVINNEFGSLVQNIEAKKRKTKDENTIIL
ncbi:hypothetical protein LAZ67_14002472 [Cordylochernes scorpioides]|uniref:Uncharacterized protein n=1 Tax=Cordylochernes scorpioides TaxID=51811 RepID=A0ABY6L6Y1_9ARAC|nr:hypothetical protein LAZ67_14002472 [Cordylochernes scorpioides]